MSAAPISLGLVLVLTIVSYRHARATRRSWDVAAPFLEPARCAAPLGAGTELARARVGELNEATIELDGMLRQAGAVARACAKAALATGALGAVLDGAALLHGDPAARLGAALSFVGGCMGALACTGFGRAAEREAGRVRSAWDALIRRSTRDVAT